MSGYNLPSDYPMKNNPYEDDDVRCVWCNSSCSVDEAIKMEGDYYCEDCADNIGFKCTNCGEWHPNYTSEELPNEKLVCETCFESLGYVKCKICGKVELSLEYEYYVYEHICDDCKGEK